MTDTQDVCKKITNNKKFHCSFDTKRFHFKEHTPDSLPILLENTKYPAIISALPTSHHLGQKINGSQNQFHLARHKILTFTSVPSVFDLVYKDKVQTF